MECAACCTPACSSLFYPSCAIGIGLCTCGLSLCVGLCVVSMEEEKEHEWQAEKSLLDPPTKQVIEKLDRTSPKEPKSPGCRRMPRHN